jgi:hypothetical protein
MEPPQAAPAGTENLNGRATAEPIAIEPKFWAVVIGEIPPLGCSVAVTGPEFAVPICWRDRSRSPFRPDRERYLREYRFSPSP